MTNPVPTLRETSPEERQYYRDLAAKRLQDIADWIDGLDRKPWTASDNQVDDLLRVWNHLPPKPEYRNPLEGLFPAMPPAPPKPTVKAGNYPADSRELMYFRLQPNLKIRDEHQAEAHQLAATVSKNRPRYEVIEKALGIPWWFIGAIHYREPVPAFDWKDYLGNGEPLNRKTRLMPVGRGPFASWEDGAIDALRLEGLHHHTDWSFAGACAAAEAYNGLGYWHKSNSSPYVLSYTTAYTSGKYTADKVYSSSAVDEQCGCATIWLALGVFT